MKNENTEDPSSRRTLINDGNRFRSAEEANTKQLTLFGILKNLLRGKNDNTCFREAIAEYIDEDSEKLIPSISRHEKSLIANILNLRDMSALDVMIPRADIVAIPENITQEELFALFAEKQYSRLPVYRSTLDNVIGTIHVKDVMATLAQGKKIEIPALVREIPIVSPALHVLDLLWQMRLTRKHMVLVIDEFGGIDGLITINDVIEAIVGEIEDEHDPGEEAQIIRKQDGTVIADARVDLDAFESRFGPLLDEEEREINDTLGGLIFSIAGRVPARGEVLTHTTGMVFEILDADPRRVNRVCIRNIPTHAVE